MWPSQQELDRLFRELDEHPDVAPDDRLRAIAAVGVWKVVTLGAAVVAFPLGFILAAALMMWIDGGGGVAALCGLLASLLAMGLPAASYLTGVHPKKTAGADIQNGISADQIVAQQIGKTT